MTHVMDSLGSEVECCWASSGASLPKQRPPEGELGPSQGLPGPGPAHAWTVAGQCLYFFMNDPRPGFPVAAVSPAAGP